MYSIDDVAKTDKDIADLIEAELARQNSHIELIASENWVSKAVMAAMGSLLLINMRKDIRGRDFTADVPAWMRWKLLQSNVRKNYSDVNMQMYSRTPEHRQTWQSFCNAAAGRYCNGYESGSWWTSDTWKSCKYVRNLL